MLTDSRIYQKVAENILQKNVKCEWKGLTFRIKGLANLCTFPRLLKKLSKVINLIFNVIYKVLINFVRTFFLMINKIGLNL